MLKLQPSHSMHVQLLVLIISLNHKSNGLIFLQSLVARQFRCTQCVVPTWCKIATVIHEYSAHNQLQSLEICSHILVIVPTPLRPFLQEIRDASRACKGTENNLSTCLLSSLVILLRYFRARTHILKKPQTCFSWVFLLWHACIHFQLYFFCWLSLV